MIPRTTNTGMAISGLEIVVKLEKLATMDVRRPSTLAILRIR